MQSDDEKFELFLRQFRPRRPRRPSRPARPDFLFGPPAALRTWLGAALAGLAVIAAIAVMQRDMPERDGVADVAVEPAPVNAVVLPPAAIDAAQHVANWDVAALDRLLTDLSP